MRARFERVIRDAQDSICAAIEELDGSKFRQDAWVRNEGGGGITRVMQDGNVFEKVGRLVAFAFAVCAAVSLLPSQGRQALHAVHVFTHAHAHAQRTC
jgi:coproporphyrinogen III oxidase